MSEQLVPGGRDVRALRGLHHQRSAVLGEVLQALQAAVDRRVLAGVRQADAEDVGGGGLQREPGPVKVKA